jgi:ABC-type nitrate/sulfonate/bicarbonate transport system substrate-binding protein
MWLLGVIDGLMLTVIQAKARNFPVTSIGSLLDEPFTGVVYLKDSGITEDFRSLKGKRIGYVGEFGKVCLDFLLWIQGHVLTAVNDRSKSMSSPSTTA